MYHIVAIEKRDVSMTKFEIIAQAIGVAAMVFNITSYQRRTPGGVIAFQLIGSTLFAVSFFMLGATVGALMNVIGAVICEVLSLVSIVTAYIRLDKKSE